MENVSVKLLPFVVERMLDEIIPKMHQLSDDDNGLKQRLSVNKVGTVASLVDFTNGQTKKCLIVDYMPLLNGFIVRYGEDVEFVKTNKLCFYRLPDVLTGDGTTEEQLKDLMWKVYRMNVTDTNLNLLKRMYITVAHITELEKYESMGSVMDVLSEYDELEEELTNSASKLKTKVDDVLKDLYDNYYDDKNKFGKFWLSAFEEMLELETIDLD